MFLAAILSATQITAFAPGVLNQLFKYHQKEWFRRNPPRALYEVEFPSATYRLFWALLKTFGLSLIYGEYSSHGGKMFSSQTPFSVEEMERKNERMQDAE